MAKVNIYLTRNICNFCFIIYWKTFSEIVCKIFEILGQADTRGFLLWFGSCYIYPCQEVS